jgi:hypothetical protein
MEATEIAKRMMQSAGFSFYQIDEVKRDDRNCWDVKASTLSKRVRMRINSESGKVEEFVPE